MGKHNKEYDKHFNEEKARQLGMPLGTATNRLRKRIILHLLQRSGEDICFRCGGRIETVDDLSIEHKQAWFRVDVALFWDLGNVAFSHLKCNISAGRRSTEPAVAGWNRKDGPPGTAWCAACRQFKPIAEFSRHRSRRNGLQAYCDRCRSWQRSQEERLESAKL